MKKLILFCLLFWVVGFSSTTENVTEEILNSRLTLQLGFEIPFLTTPGLAFTNGISQPIFTVSTNFLGLICRLTLNPPHPLEIQKLVEDLAKANPSFSERELFKLARDEVLSSRVLIFLEGGGVVLPLPGEHDWEWYFIPFIGVGFYFPIGTTQSFLTFHLNFPLIGGIGLTYIF